MRLFFLLAQAVLDLGMVALCWIWWREMVIALGHPVASSRLTIFPVVMTLICLVLFAMHAGMVARHFLLGREKAEEGTR